VVASCLGNLRQNDFGWRGGGDAFAIGTSSNSDVSGEAPEKLETPDHKLGTFCGKLGVRTSGFCRTWENRPKHGVTGTVRHDWRAETAGAKNTFLQAKVPKGFPNDLNLHRLCCSTR